MLKCQDRKERRKVVNRHFRECLLADVNRALSHSGAKLQKFSRWKILLWALNSRGAFAVLLFRLMKCSYRKGHKLSAFIFSELSQVLCGTEIGYNAETGPGFEIAHAGGIVITGEVIAGTNLSIRQGVTIGGNLGKKNANGRIFPIIGDNVLIGAGACIIGPIAIGSNVIIGANTVVTRDVPDNSVVAGLPGTLIKVNGKQIPICARPGELGVYLKEIDERLNKLESQVKLFDEHGLYDNREKK